MNLISINPLTKNRIKTMIRELLPEFKYMRISKSGIVTLKSNFWSLRRERVSVTDLCLKILPKRIAQEASNNNLGKGHILVFRETIAGYLELDYDVSAYVWDIFNKYCMEVPTINRVKYSELPRSTSKHDYPVLTLSSNINLYGIRKAFKNVHKDTFDEGKRLVKRIKEMQRLPSKRNKKKQLKFFIKT